MNCEAARLLIGADPHAASPELEAHLQGCTACARFRAEMRALDAHIHRAMQDPPQRGRARRAAPQWRQWALAASVVLATLAVVGVWLVRPTDSLAHEVVQHVQGEPESWFAAQQVSTAEIDKALRGAGVQLDLTSTHIMYAQSCFFRGHYVPHLVVQTAAGPATVMILRHQQVAGRASFHEAGLDGVIVPAPHGSIAVLTRGPANLDGIAAEVEHDMRWQR
ncbi:MAG TPA: DUF3379 family protein [Steroidobacteraceae bacterium]|nr:DUF3379 family protein [Steroidobacteraceae bacterium]